MTSKICEEQHKLEQLENDNRSEELLDESMEEEDNHREPADIRSASIA